MDKGDLCECVQNLKIIIFHIYFFNMDISLIISLICLTIRMYIPSMYLEGGVSQNVDIGLCYCFIVCRRWKLGKKIQKVTIVTRSLS